MPRCWYANGEAAMASPFLLRVLLPRYFCAGRISPTHVPNPTRYPSPWHHPASVSSSPSSINPRVPPSFNSNGFLPFHVDSSRLPHESAVGPLIVPEPIRSPTRVL